MTHPMTGDLRLDVAAFLDDYPRWVIYIRRDLRFPCACFHSATMEGDAECAQCLGTGYRFTLQKINTRETVRGRAPALSRSEALQPPGWVMDYPITYYMKRVVCPKVLDRIAVVEWDVPMAEVPARGTPVRLTALSKIGLANDGYDSRLAYFTCYCQSLNFTRVMDAVVLRGLRGIPVLDSPG